MSGKLSIVEFFKNKGGDNTMKKKITMFVPWFYSTEYLLEFCPKIACILGEFIKINGGKDVIEYLIWTGNPKSLLGREPALVMFFGEPVVPASLSDKKKSIKRAQKVLENCVETGHFLFWYDKQIVFSWDNKENFKDSPSYLWPPKDQHILLKVDANKIWSKTWSLELVGSDMEANLREFLGFGENLKIVDSKDRC